MCNLTIIDLTVFKETEMDVAINDFCDQVSVRGSISLRDCGINTSRQFIFGRTVGPSDHRRLLGELKRHPALMHLVGKSVVTTHELSSYYNYPATGSEKRLPGHVTLVTCNEGLLTWVKRENGIKPYGIVNSVDVHRQLESGVAKVIRDNFGGAGGHYHQVSRQPHNRINYGECFTYNCNRGSKASSLDNCLTVHNVLVPFAGEPNFAATLKNTFLEVFQAADSNGLPRVFTPLLSCGRAGGTGAALAKAVAEAKADFESTGKQAPELILVGMSSSAGDRAACADFESQWHESYREIPSTRSLVRRSATPYPGTSPIAGTPAFSSATDTEKPLPGGVTLVTCNRGLLTWVERQNGSIPYGVVNSVDVKLQLDSGIAKVIRDNFGGAGGHYHQVSWQPRNRINYGECFTYDCKRGGKRFDLHNCQTIHNVLVPLASDRNFAATLKKTFLEVFNAADRQGLHRVFCPLLGCGLAGGTGTALAKAVAEAKADFESTGKRAPELILVGMSSQGKDRAACTDFERQWYESGRRIPAARSPVRSVKTPAAMASSGAAASTSTTATTSTAATRATKAGSGYNTSSVLIRDQLEVVMHPDKGMFGYAKELSKQGTPFDLVNAANSRMKHGGGIAKQFSDDLGNEFDRDTHRQAPVHTGMCYTTGPYGYARNPKFGLRHCQHIHNVVAPNVADYTVSVKSSGVRNKAFFDQQKYHQDFTNAFVSLLLEAHNKGSNTIVSCFIGCAIFGGSGSGMAHALHAAYRDPRIQALSKVPKLILVGWKDDDWKVHDTFIRTFKSLNTANPVRLPPVRAAVSDFPAGISGKIFPANPGAIPKQTSPYFRSQASTTSVFSRPGRMTSGRTSPGIDAAFSSSAGTGSEATGVSRSQEGAATAFRESSNAIDCGICGESKPEKGSQQVKGLQVCSDCAVDYQDQGVSLSEAAKLAEEFAAINYRPLQIRQDSRDLPGYPGAGRIIVRIEATAPSQLSDGRRLDMTYKNETHYLPNNAVGKELLRLLAILHQEKLIYKIDKSNTTGKFGITFNVHLKTSDSGGEGNHGYPDTTYQNRALNEIVGLASIHSLQDKLDTSKLVRLLFSDR
ncbi:macro domain-containing protein [Endozoicomonas sp. SCSIO W0465]|uniref:macro domain-containing protein n=1 Tax=Endozoicomonas sp. SCSIO W0465 TaxID=2918516 RepID=UPI0020750870|nr:macro domain-containing protein [Endozoicomonas sp. SCSIO W0465]USE35934.1 macro domain-containing protein [Endozoicomonas sp. SCSIO W0465]